MKDKLFEMGAITVRGTPEEFTDHVRREVATRAKVVKDASIRSN